MRHPEFELQKAVCNYLRLQYPKVLFLSDTVASVKLTMPQAARNKAIQKEGIKTPDLIIFQPNELYHGLFIELKIETPFKKDGQLKSNEHLEGQSKTIVSLNELGYKATFAWSFDQAKQIIDDYINLM